MKKNTGWIVAVIVLSLMLVFSMVFSAAGRVNPPATSAPLESSAPVAAPTATLVFPTSTPDPCSPAGLPDEVARVHSLTREFEDTAQILTSTLLRDSSVPLVQDLQRIRRLAEDQSVPPCLKDLKIYQINHMNARIDVFGTALSFMNTYGPSGDQKALNQLLEPLYIKATIAAYQYESEYARLMGLPTPVMPAGLVTITPTP